MPKRAPHYISIAAAIPAGFWAATSTPATRQFELAMRALGWTGPVLSPLNLLYDSTVTLLAMAVVYGIAMTIFERLGISLRDEWGDL